MRKLLALVLLVVLAGSVSASCRTYCDWFANISLGDYGASQPVLVNVSDFVYIDNQACAGSCPACWNLSICSNVEGEYYAAQTNKSTIYLTVHNLDTSDWAVRLNTSSTEFDSERIFVTCSDCGGGYLEICLNGSSTGHAYTYASLDAGSTLDVVASDFTQYYRRNWTFKDEETNSAYPFTGLTANLTVSCGNYAGFTLPLSACMTVQTREQAKYTVAAYNATTPVQIRVREDDDHFLRDDFYLIKTAGSGVRNTLQLVDYTPGQFYQSIIKIQRPVSGSMKNVHVEQFDQSNLIYPYLINNTDYRVVVVGSSTRDLGIMSITHLDTDRDVMVTTPDLGRYPYVWDNILLSFTSDYDTSTVGATYNFTGGVGCSRVEFYVYNTTTTPYPLDYNANSTANDTTFSKTVGNNAGTYLLRVKITDTNGKVMEQSMILTLRNSSAYYKGFDLNLPATFIGLSRTWAYNLAALFIVTIVFALFSAITHGTGAIVGAGAFAFMVFVGWLTAPTWYVAYISFLAFFLKLSEKRTEAVG